jgi:DNA-binding transcriptional LysR family regulator
MDLNQLRVFFHAAKLKSFSRAAEALFVTRPLISIRVKQLEDAYGVKFFERTGRGMALTNAGEALFSYAQRIFTLVAEADTHMEDMKEIKFGTLRICTGLTVGTYYLPPLITAFQKKYPNIEIQMKVKNKKEVVDDILALRDDLGFVGNMEPNATIIVTPLWEDELVIIVSRSHPLAKCATIAPSQLNAQTFILREKGSGTRELVESTLQRHRIAVHTALELGSDEAIKRAVEVGLGASIVPLGVVKEEVRKGVIRAVRLAPESIVMQYVMLYHKDKYISRIIGAFIDMAKASRVEPRAFLSRHPDAARRRS